MPAPARPTPVADTPVINYQTPEAARIAKAAKVRQYILVLGLLGLTLAALIYALCVSTIGWHNTLYSDRHQFRQSQTAISCYYMLQNGYTLDYETPVMGPPWRMPFEFPLYHWVVVWAVKTFHAGLDPSGRGVSLVFYLLTLVPVYFILQTLNVKPVHRSIFAVLMLVSPFYLFWSRAFMIESTAVCLSMAYLACVFQWAWRRGNGTRLFPLVLLLVAALVLGVLAGMVKITTFFSFGLAVPIFLVRDIFRWPVPRSWPIRRMIEGLVVLALVEGIPLAAVMGWTAHADKLKALSPITTYLQSTNPAMEDWNFGTIEQRFNFETWSTIIGRCGTLTAPEWTFWLGCLVAVLFTRRRWKEVLALVVLYLSAPVVFVHLHLERDYYMYANGIFLLGAAGFCLLALFESRHALTIGFAALLITCVAAVAEFSTAYYPMMAKNNTGLQPVIDAIDKACDKDSVVIYMGLWWDPTLPYYSQRRAFMIDATNPAWPTEEDVRKELVAMKDCKIGCIVEIEPVGRIERGFVIVAMKSLGLDTSKELHMHR